MIPILYNVDERNFNHRGLGALNGLLEYKVTEELNGQFDATFEYPVAGDMYQYIEDFMLIKAVPNRHDEAHVFRIYETELDIERQTLIIYARSNIYDLAGNMVRHTGVKDMTPTEAWRNAVSASIEPVDITFDSTITTPSSTTWTRRNLLSCIVGEQGSMLQIWGGELKYGNKKVWLYRRRGDDNVTTIRYGKNLAGLKATYSTKGVVTAILPYFNHRDDESGEEKVITGDVVKSDLVNSYPYVLYEAVEYNEDDGVTDLESLNRVAGRYFKDYPDKDKPSINMEVNMLDLSHTKEYEKFKDLEQVKLGDTVTVYAKKFGVNITAKVNKITYNGLTEENEVIEIGATRASQYDNYRELIDRTVDKSIQPIKEQLNIVQISASGKNRVFRGPQEPTEGMIEGDLWFKTLGSGEREMYIYNGWTWGDPIDFDEANRKVAHLEEQLERFEEDLTTTTELANDVSEKATQLEQNYQDVKASADSAMNKAVDAYTDAQSAITKANEVQGLATDLSGQVSDFEVTVDGFNQTVNDYGRQVSGFRNDITGFESTVAQYTTVVDEYGNAVDTYATAVSSLTNTVDGFQSKVDKVEEDYQGISGTVATHTSQISNLNGEIALKADATTVNSLTGRVSTAESGIAANASDIKLKASQSSVDTLSGQVSTLDSEIDVVAGKISSRVWKSDIDDAIGKTGVTLEDKTEVLSGTDIYTDKADDSVVHVDVDGKSYQHAGSGKNLFSKGLWENSEQINSNGVPLIWIEVKPNTDYTLSTNAKRRRDVSDETTDIRGYVYFTDSKIELGWYINGVIEDSPRTVNSGDEGIVRVGINLSYFNFERDWIQIEEGPTATEYEPPAPTPDYPIEIHSLNDFDVVSSVGKRNLVRNGNFANGKSNWRDNGTSEVKYDSSIDKYYLDTLPDSPSTRGVYQTLDLEDGKSYNFSFLAKAPTGSSRVNIGPDNRRASVNISGDWKRYSTDYVYRSNDRTTFTVYGSHIYITDIQVNEGRETPWNPYLSEITEGDNHPLINKINLLLSEPLRSVGDVKDRLFRDSDGLWKVERKVNEYTFTGSESFGANSTYGAYYSTGDSLHDENIIGVKSNYLKSASGRDLVSGEKNAIGLASNTRAVRMSIMVDGTQLTNSTIKPWLTQKYNSGNPLIIQYLVETPTIETLDQDLQDKLNNLRSFQDSNYVYTILDKTDILSERLKPTLHATFKGGGWYNRWKTRERMQYIESEWTQTFDMFSQTVSGIDGRVTSQKQTLDSISSTVSEHGSKISAVEQTADGLQTIVGDLEEATTSQFNVMSDEISAVVGKVNNIGGRNLIRNSNDMEWLPFSDQTVNVSDSSLLDDGQFVTAVGGNHDIKTYHDFTDKVTDVVEGELYTFSVTIYNGSVNEAVISINGLDTQPQTLQGHETKRLAFTGTRGSDQLQIQVSNSGRSIPFHVAKPKLEKGEVATDWSPAPEDGVSKNELISEINIQADRQIFRVGDNRLMITEDTTYLDNAVIKNAHIADLAVTGAKIADASISSAKIINLDVDKITGNTTNFIQSSWNNISTQISIDDRGINVTGSDQWRRTYFNQTGFELFNGSGAYNKAGVIGYFKPSRDVADWDENVFNTTRGGTPRHSIGIGANYTHDIAFGYNPYSSTNRVFQPAMEIRGDTGDIDISTQLVMRGNSITRISTAYFEGNGRNEIGWWSNHMTYHGQNGHKFYAQGKELFNVQVNGYANLYARLNMHGHDVYNQSDARLKRDIMPSLKDSLGKFSKLEFKWFEYLENRGLADGLHHGVIAQDVLKFAPEWVIEDEQGYYSLNQSAMLMDAFKAIMQLSQKVKKLEAK